MTDGKWQSFIMAAEGLLAARDMLAVYEAELVQALPADGRPVAYNAGAAGDPRWTMYRRRSGQLATDPGRDMEAAVPDEKLLAALEMYEQWRGEERRAQHHLDTVLRRLDVRRVVYRGLLFQQDGLLSNPLPCVVIEENGEQRGGPRADPPETPAPGQESPGFADSTRGFPDGIAPDAGDAETDEKPEVERSETSGLRNAPDDASGSAGGAPPEPLPIPGGFLCPLCGRGCAWDYDAEACLDAHQCQRAECRAMATACVGVIAASVAVPDALDVVEDADRGRLLAALDAVEACRAAAKAMADD